MLCCLSKAKERFMAYNTITLEFRLLKAKEKGTMSAKDANYFIDLLDSNTTREITTLEAFIENTYDIFADKADAKKAIENALVAESGTNLLSALNLELQFDNEELQEIVDSVKLINNTELVN